MGRFVQTATTLQAFAAPQNPVISDGVQTSWVSRKNSQTSGYSSTASSGLHNRDANAKEGPAMGSSISAAEVRKFEELAKDWWDPDGSSAPLHSMNPIRTHFTRDALCLCFGRESRSPQPLQGLTILDVGCGGGLFSEALARLGASVTGIDASQAGIFVAREHARADPLIHERTTYRNITAEQAVEEGLQFDAVVASEVIEHVENVPAFCNSLAALTKDSGAVIISTINRTPASYAVAIVGAEYIAQVVPKGTHDWSRFITPDELSHLMEGVGLPQVSISGMFMNPVTRKWSLINDVGVNYIAYFKRKISVPV
ncbi:g10471 [Coccomyxa elongata]